METWEDYHFVFQLKWGLFASVEVVYLTVVYMCHHGFYRLVTYSLTHAGI